MEKIKSFINKYLNKKVVLAYIYSEFASRLLGFIVSMWAISLVAHFFEYPSFKNLWGLNSHKTLVSKTTFENLKWIAQVIIGFFVFEVIHKILFTKLSQRAPEYYKKGMDYLEKNGVNEKARNIKIAATNKIKENISFGKEKLKEFYNKRT